MPFTSTSIVVFKLRNFEFCSGISRTGFSVARATALSSVIVSSAGYRNGVVGLTDVDGGLLLAQSASIIIGRKTSPVRRAKVALVTKLGLERTFLGCLGALVHAVETRCRCRTGKEKSAEQHNVVCVMRVASRTASRSDRTLEKR